MGVPGAFAALSPDWVRGVPGWVLASQIKICAQSWDDSWVCLGESGCDTVGSGVALRLAPSLSTEVWPQFEDGQAGAAVSTAKLTQPTDPAGGSSQSAHGRSW